MKLKLHELEVQSMDLKELKLDPRSEVKKTGTSKAGTHYRLAYRPIVPLTETPKYPVEHRDMGGGVHIRSIKGIERIYMTMATTRKVRAQYRALTLFEGNVARVHFTVYGNLCTNIKAVRACLDGGALAKLIAEQERKFDPKKEVDGPDGYRREGYKLVFLGACAMSLGCSLPPAFSSWLKQHFKQVGLKRDAVKQMDEALNGPKKYQPGVPYDFGSFGLYDTMLAGGPPKEDKYFESEIINVEWPGGMKASYLRKSVSAAKESEDNDDEEDIQEKGKKDDINCKSDTKTKRSTKKQQSKRDKQRFTNREGGVDVGEVQDECARCAATEAEAGGALMACGKCLNVKYCSKKCQAKDWAEHKKVCKKAETPGE